MTDARSSAVCGPQFRAGGEADLLTDPHPPRHQQAALGLEGFRRQCRAREKANQKNSNTRQRARDKRLKTGLTHRFRCKSTVGKPKTSNPIPDGWYEDIIYPNSVGEVLIISGGMIH